MALKDLIPLGMSLPHRSSEPTPLPVTVVAQVAQRAEALGFQDLWVTDNLFGRANCFNALTVLTYAAALTTRIRLGVSVLVLPVYHPIHVAHQVATLDQLSGGRAILGVGIGRNEDYPPFQVPSARRVRRFSESIGLIKALWTESDVNFQGQIYQLEHAQLGTPPVQRPYPPIWLGSTHPDAVRRAAVLGDGWMGAGGSSTASFAQNAPLLREALQQHGRDSASFPISKRLFLSVHERADVAKAEVHNWFSEVYHNPDLTASAGVHGTPEQVREQLEALVAMGANHLLLNPVSRYAEQLEALAEITGLS